MAIEFHYASAIRAAQQAHHDAPEAERPALRVALQEVRAKQSAHLTEGAHPCPVCKEPPHGMINVRPSPLKGETLEVYTVGCLGCRDIRAEDLSRLGAISKWNEKVEATLAVFADAE